MSGKSPDDIASFHKKIIGKNKANRWRLDDDGSIRDRIPNPVELVSPILSGPEGEKAVRDVCALAKEYEFNPNYIECGFHVHLGAKELQNVRRSVVLSNDERNALSKCSNIKICSEVFVTEEACNTYCFIDGARTKKPSAHEYRSAGGKHYSTGFGTTTIHSGWMDGVVTSRGKGYIVQSTVFGGESRVIFVISQDNYESTLEAQRSAVRDLKDRVSALHAKEAGILLGSPTPVNTELRELRLEIARLNNELSLVKRTHEHSIQEIATEQLSCDGKWVCEIEKSIDDIVLSDILLFYHIFDPVLLGMLPPSRRQDNMYCMPISESFQIEDILSCRTQKDFERLWYKAEDPLQIDAHKSNHYDDSRYHNVNFHSLFNRHGTIEIRSHSSTINPNKILLWVALHQQIIDCIIGKEISRDSLLELRGETNLETLARRMTTMLSLPPHLKKYVYRLLNYFSNTNIT